MEIDFELLYRFVIAVDILLCAAIILCNFLLLLSILCSKKARARTRNAMLVSVCIADLLVGAFTHPIYIHSYHTGTLFHSCEMHILMQLIGDYSQDFVCFWTLVTLGTIYVYRLAAERWGWGSSLRGNYGRLSPPPSRCDSLLRLLKKVCQAFAVGWPWLGTLLIPIPILMATVDQSTRDAFWDETFCPLHTPFPSRMVVLVLVFYLPIAALLVLCVGLALLMYWDMVHATQPRHSPVQHSSDMPHAGGGSSRLQEGVDFEGRETANGHLEGNVVYREGGVAPARGETSLDQGEVLSDDPSCPVLSDDRDAERSSASHNDTAFQPTANDCTINTQDIDPSVVLVGGRGGRGERGVGRDSEVDGEPLERPGHVLIPFLVTVVCALPLMIGWWFYSRMPRNAVIIVSVTLSRVYLLRAALLPVAWFTLPELRQAAVHLWDRMNGRGGRGSGARREMGEFSVAYTTLRESRDAPASACDGEEGREVRRQNPFDPNFVAV